MHCCRFFPAGVDEMRHDGPRLSETYHCARQQGLSMGRSFRCRRIYVRVCVCLCVDVDRRRSLPDPIHRGSFSRSPCASRLRFGRRPRVASRLPAFFWPGARRSRLGNVHVRMRPNAAGLCLPLAYPLSCRAIRRRAPVGWRYRAPGRAPT